MRAVARPSCRCHPSRAGNVRGILLTMVNGNGSREERNWQHKRKGAPRRMPGWPWAGRRLASGRRLRSARPAAVEPQAQSRRDRRSQASPSIKVLFTLLLDKGYEVAPNEWHRNAPVLCPPVRAYGRFH